MRKDTGSLIRLAVMLMILVGGAVRAEVKLPALFSHNMLLQAGRPVPIWGTASPGEKVSVRFAGQSHATVTGPDGRWRLQLKPLVAGTAGEMLVAGLNRISITNVLAGTVWVCSGQSNMDVGMGLTRNAGQEIEKADFSSIRLFQVTKRVAYEPCADVEGQWLECSPATIIKGSGWGRGFSAVAYFFGREIHQGTGLPVGLIQSAWCSTSVQMWTSLGGLKQIPCAANDVAAYAKAAAGNPATNTPSAPTVLFNGMINPLIPYAIEGVIWYQGEDNDRQALAYAALFQGLIQDWRARWGQGDFPFLFCQLANCGGKTAAPVESSWAQLRESQRQALRLPNTGMAVLIDIGEGMLHPVNKQDVGLRLARIALAKVFGKGGRYTGPVLQSVQAKGDKLTLAFDPVGGELVARALPAADGAIPPGKPEASVTRSLPGNSLTGFAVCGADRKWAWAEAAIDGMTVVVSAAEVAAPEAVRYAWAGNPTCNLYNKEGLPAAPFQAEVTP